MIEIEEVLVPTMASGLSAGTERGEDLALDVFLLGRGLDDEIAVAEIVDASLAGAMRSSAAWRSSSLMRWRLTWRARLPLMVAKPAVDALGRDVVEHDVEAGERADMGDAVAHLTGADDADLADRMPCCLYARPFAAIWVAHASTVAPSTTIRRRVPAAASSSVNA